MNKIVVCGGAGYIGSHVTLSLLRRGYTPVIVDNFTNSDPSVIARMNSLVGLEVECHEVDLTNQAAVSRTFQKVMPSAIIQLAGLKSVGQSVAHPVDYYSVNLGITLNILSAMTTHSCDRIVFSSSATVYGEPEYVPIDEAHVVAPINPYGRTKYF